ncbi:MAG: DUF4349 domain-containing protein [Coriobacteriia bacterium]|nr:DUF4349 domain-containing protein [Coriobacteriia bacterium]
MRRKANTGRTWGFPAALLLGALLLAAAGCTALNEEFRLIGGGGEDSTDSSPEPAPAPAEGPFGMAGDPAYPDDGRARHPVEDPSAGGSTQEGPLAGEKDAGSDGQAAATSADRMIVRTKSMLVRVEDVEEAVSSIRALAGKHEAFIEALRLADEPDVPVYREDSSERRPLSAYVTVRVPVARFERFVEEASGIGRVLRQSEDASDVTQQHVDLKARLQNLRAEEKRLREMFEKAEKVDEMLAVERELARVRGEAEAMQARIDHLERQAALSAVTVELVGPERIVQPAGTDWGVADAFRQGVRAFVGSFNAMVVLVMGSAIPVAAIVVLGLVARRLLRRRRAAAAAGE